MPKSRKFRKNNLDSFGIFLGRDTTNRVLSKAEVSRDPIQEAIIKAKRDVVPFTEFAKVLPKPKNVVVYYQKNHGKYRKPSIVILNQKIQGKSKKMGSRSSIGKHKKTRRNRSKKYRGGMMGGNPPKPVKGINPAPVIVQGQGTNLGPQFAVEPTREQTGQRNLYDEY